jgi:Putative zinc-finger
MKCSDVDRILPDIVDGVPIDGSQDLEVQSHLKICPDCSELVSDLKLIASEARQLSECEEPSPRVWARIATELRAEGLIREPELETARPVLVPARQRRWSPFWFAPVAAAILAAGSYLLIHHPSHHATAQVVQQPAEQTSQARVAQQPTAQEQASVPTSQSPAVLPDQTAEGPVEQADLSPQVSDNEFLSEVSTRAPGMRATYANQLQAVNKEIRETKAYLSQYPGDIDARQHLLEVYQQKAMLYQMALDRIQ